MTSLKRKLDRRLRELTATKIGFAASAAGGLSLLAALRFGVPHPFVLSYVTAVSSGVAIGVSLAAGSMLARRKAQYHQLEESVAAYRLISDRSGDLLMVAEPDGTIRFASPSFELLSGRSSEELAGTKAPQLILPHDRPKVMAARARAIEDPESSVCVEFRVGRADGTVGWFEGRMRAIVEDGGEVTGLVSIGRDISARRAREEQLSRDAGTDPLTGLANRRGFDEACQATSKRKAQVGCVAVFDLDHFKQVNDRFGHAAGDDALIEFGKILSRTVRDGDLVARLGGEEFAAVLAGATVEQATLVCERIRQAVEKADIRTADGASVDLTVSIGLRRYDEHTPIALAMPDADAALYRAKTDGRNRLALAA